MVTLFEKYKFFEYFIYLTIILKIFLILVYAIKYIGKKNNVKFFYNYNIDLDLVSSFLHSSFIISTCLILIYIMNPFYPSGHKIGTHTKFLLFVFSLFTLNDFIYYSPDFYKIKNILVKKKMNEN